MVLQIIRLFKPERKLFEKEKDTKLEFVFILKMSTSKYFTFLNNF